MAGMMAAAANDFPFSMRGREIAPVPTLRCRACANYPGDGKTRCAVTKRAITGLSPANNCWGFQIHTEND